MKLRFSGIWLVLLLAVMPVAHAASGDPAFTLDCGGYHSNGGALALDRDNTGALSEAFIISAVDGAGNQILDAVHDVFYVGTAVQFNAGTGGAWTQAPRYNPLVLQVVSPAGNGLDEQVVTQVTGECAGLPRFGAFDWLAALQADVIRQLTGEAFVLQPADGVTSEPVALNEAPPRPINPDGLPQTQPGYAVVNTDNLSLRSGDSPQYELIGVLDGGTELVVLGRNADLTWLYVQVGGLRGWVSSEFLVLRGDLTGVPQVPVTGSITAPSLYVGYTGNPVYAVPVLGTSVLCRIAGNTSYPLLGQTDNSAWYQIEVSCDGAEPVVAWIAAELGIVRNSAGVRIPVTY